MTENESSRGWQWLLPISLVADISAVVTVLAGSASVLWLVLGSVALLLGLGQLFLKLGKPVDRAVLLAVLGIALGTAAITAVATRSITDTPVQASGSTTTSSSTGTTPSSPPGTTTPPTTTSSSTAPKEPGVKRESGAKSIALTTGYGLDLDSANEPWIAEKSSASTKATEDLAFSISGYLTAEKHLADVKSAEATRDDCERAGPRRLADPDAIFKGAVFCVRTSEGAIARVRILEEDENQKLTLDVVVWGPKT